MAAAEGFGFHPSAATELRAIPHADALYRRLPFIPASAIYNRRPPSARLPAMAPCSWQRRALAPPPPSLAGPPLIYCSLRLAEKQKPGMHEFVNFPQQVDEETERWGERINREAFDGSRRTDGTAGKP
ncbi:hypothetical protein EYF80_015153 [Liparis tanakae]|uniref:Uncharacterized protein n=1 Tax=Liparis tanakae TaxID=230148 RepID=A0A4Z2I9A3_9TELE|nr:hypothetical protein EYF80_015153 [Liparis tanakae]